MRYGLFSLGTIKYMFYFDDNKWKMHYYFALMWLLEISCEFIKKMSKKGKSVASRTWRKKKDDQAKKQFQISMKKLTIQEDIRLWRTKEFKNKIKMQRL